MKNTLLFIFICMAISIHGQAPDNDQCKNAVSLCNNQKLRVDNINSTVKLGQFEEDGNGNPSGCALVSKNVWFKVNTNENGGELNITINNYDCIQQIGKGKSLQTYLLTASLPCDASTYSMEGGCNISDNSIDLNYTNLIPDTTYYLVIDGALIGSETSPAECSFDIIATGDAITPSSLNPTISTQNNNFCPNELVETTVTCDTCEGNISFSWFINDVWVEDTQDSLFLVNNLPPGQNNIKAVVFCESLGCTFSDTSSSISIQIPEILVDAGNDVTIQNGEATTLEGDADGTYLWEPAFSLNDPTSQNPIARPDMTTVYTLETQVGNCKVYDQVTVFVEPSVFIPNTITPNEDGYNDFWPITNIENFPKNSIEVYNRWGQRVFKASGYTNSNQWDAKYAGKLLPAATYYYIVDLGLNDESYIFKGGLTIVY